MRPTASEIVAINNNKTPIWDVAVKNIIPAIVDRSQARFELKSEQGNLITRTLDFSSTTGEIKNFIVGLIVDSVSKVILINTDEVQPTPGILNTQIGIDFISGITKIDGKATVILKLDNLFTKEEMKNLIGTK